MPVSPERDSTPRSPNATDLPLLPESGPTLVSDANAALANRSDFSRPGAGSQRRSQTDLFLQEYSSALPEGARDARARRVLSRMLHRAAQTIILQWKSFWNLRTLPPPLPPAPEPSATPLPLDRKVYGSSVPSIPSLLPSAPPLPLRKVEYEVLPLGILDPALLNRVDAIAHQVPCALPPKSSGWCARIASTLPYGCAYQRRKARLQRTGILNKLAGVAARLLAWLPSMGPSTRPGFPQDPDVWSLPGSIEVCFPPSSLSPATRGSGIVNPPLVVGLLSQFGEGVPTPSNPLQPGPVSDDHEDRLQWFSESLGRVAKLPSKPASIAVPHGIGCGSGGGGGGWTTSRSFSFLRCNTPTSVLWWSSLPILSLSAPTGSKDVPAGTLGRMSRSGVALCRRRWHSPWSTA